MALTKNSALKKEAKSEIFDFHKDPVMLNQAQTAIYLSCENNDNCSYNNTHIHIVSKINIS